MVQGESFLSVIVHNYPKDFYCFRRWGWQCTLLWYEDFIYPVHYIILQIFSLLLRHILIIILIKKKKQQVKLTCRGTIFTNRTGNWRPVTVCFSRNVSGTVSFFNPLKHKHNTRIETRLQITDENHIISRVTKACESIGKKDTLRMYPM